ncbi:MAG: hypothetical protein IJL60_03565, partial [Clostridiales bacterium]|nr:hypothetical protein [Clostridiales bacterium]
KGRQAGLLQVRLLGSGGGAELRIGSAQWRIAGADATNWVVLLARNNQSYFIRQVEILRQQNQL